MLQIHLLHGDGIHFFLLYTFIIKGAINNDLFYQYFSSFPSLFQRIHDIAKQKLKPLRVVHLLLIALGATQMFMASSFQFCNPCYGRRIWMCSFLQPEKALYSNIQKSFTKSLRKNWHQQSYRPVDRGSTNSKSWSPWSLGAQNCSF